MTMMIGNARTKVLKSLQVRGFDTSRAGRDRHDGVRVGCSQCEAMVICGVPCHETGCPNKPGICQECGQIVAKGETCCGPQEMDGWDESNTVEVEG